MIKQNDSKIKRFFAVAHDSKEIDSIKTHVSLTCNDDTKQSDYVDSNNIDAQYKEWERKRIWQGITA